MYVVSPNEPNNVITILSCNTILFSNFHISIIIVIIIIIIVIIIIIIFSSESFSFTVVPRTVSPIYRLFPSSRVPYVHIYVSQNVITFAIFQIIQLICLDRFVNVVYHHQC